jgi:MSHA type pilus biogenesis protein MshL
MRLHPSLVAASQHRLGPDSVGGESARSLTVVALVCGLTLLAGCGNVPTKVEPSQGHITAPPKAAGEILAPVRSTGFAVPAPKPTLKPQTYSVVVNDVPVRELLLALARDTRQNIDIHPGLTGLVSINAINETLPAILDRVAKQVNMRYRQEGGIITVQPDTPYLKTYRVNYVNMERDSESRIGVSGAIATATGGGGGGGGGQGANQSQTTVNTKSQNHFWELLQTNLRSILASTRALAQSAEERAARGEAQRAQREERIAQAEAVARAGAGATALFKEVFQARAPELPGDVSQDIVVNPVAGTVSVLATERQHQLVQQHIDSVMNSVQRQVMIEATIVEVRLSDAYQAGVDWSRLPVTGGLSFVQSLLGGFGGGLNQAGANSFQVGYINPDSAIGNISATIRLLQEFGSTRVLSSPKLMALNNQTALLKVVDNIVYFEVSSSTTTNQTQATVSVNTTAKTVSVGVVMGVTPQINEDGRVTLTVRPTVSRVLSFKNDPNPLLVIPNRVPEVQTREMESVLQVGTGQTVVLGGLMQDDATQNREQIPGADTLGGAISELFRFRDNRAAKTELVIFLRPTVVTNPSLDSDELKFFQRFLPQAAQTRKDAPR